MFSGPINAYKDIEGIYTLLLNDNRSYADEVDLWYKTMNTIQYLLDSVNLAKLGIDKVAELYSSTSNY